MVKLDYNIVNENVVKHEGFVAKISDDVITVSLEGNINCEACKAKAACGISESNTKEIELLEANQTFALNEKVYVILEKQVGLKAVFLAYVLPFILMLFTLLISSNFYKEWIAGLCSLLVLVPYYFMLYILRNSIKKALRISILKYN